MFIKHALPPRARYPYGSMAVDEGHWSRVTPAETGPSRTQASISPEVHPPSPVLRPEWDETHHPGGHEGWRLCTRNGVGAEHCSLARQSQVTAHGSLPGAVWSAGTAVPTWLRSWLRSAVAPLAVASMEQFPGVWFWRLG